MKTERRHELQHNELADRLALMIENLAPYGRMIGGGVLLVLVAVVAYVVTSNRTASYNAKGWDEYFSAFNQGSEEKLADVSKKYPGSPVAEWSKLLASDMLLGQGIEQLFTDKAQGKTKLQDAADGYQSVLANAHSPLVKQRALFGLARAHESRGELGKAREEYAQLVKEYPKSAFSKTAEQRVKELETTDAKQFYDWFAKYEPPRAPAGTPGSRPVFDLPSDIDFKPESSGGDKLESDSGVGAGDLPSSDSLLEDNLPSTVKPTDEVPASDVPAEKVPAEEKPADTKPEAAAK